jgi:DNA-directed RNA polymerase specialized sigma24 family protein
MRVGRVVQGRAERRIVLILHHVDEMTTREIAEALEIPKGTADMRLRRARQDFKAAWSRYVARTRRESGQGPQGIA